MSKELYGKSLDTEQILQNIFSTRNLAIKKPVACEVWLTVEKKPTKQKAIKIIEKLCHGDFCTLEEIQPTSLVLLEKLRIKIAKLPKTCVENYMRDVRALYNKCEINLCFTECM